MGTTPVLVREVRLLGRSRVRMGATGAEDMALSRGRDGTEENRADLAIEGSFEGHGGR
jgi:hypothetical protein